MYIVAGLSAGECKPSRLLMLKELQTKGLEETNILSSFDRNPMKEHMHLLYTYQMPARLVPLSEGKNAC